jgi:hypothetical protein
MPAAQFHMKLGHMKHAEMLASLGDSIRYDGALIEAAFTQFTGSIPEGAWPTTVEVTKVVRSIEAIERNLTTLRQHLRESQ